MIRLTSDDILEYGYVRRMDSATLEHSAAEAVRGLLEDGAEMSQVINIMRVHGEKRGVVFGRGENCWMIQRADGLIALDEQGEPLMKRSIHEILDWLFTLPEVTP